MRPTNAPQPLHHRKFRESNEYRWRAEASPGPARYSGVGVSTFEKSSLGGTFSKQSRFVSRESGPSDKFSSAERSSTTDGVGPKYSPKFLDTKLPTSFSTTSHLTTAKDSAVPGPGAYTPDLQWDRGVTIPTSHRTTRSANNSPGPGAYSPTKLALRTRSAFLGSASSATTRNLQDYPQLASLTSIDKSMSVTRSQSPAIGFGKAPRKLVLGNMSESPHGICSYDVSKASTVTSKAIKGGKLGTAARMPDIKPDTDGRLVALPPAEITSNHAGSTSISFGKSSRGEKDTHHSSGAGGGVPTAKYSPAYSMVDANIKGVVAWGKPTVRQGRSVLQPSVTSKADFIEASSTLGGPCLSFAEAVRPKNRNNGIPGPGAYSPNIAPLKKEPRSSGISKAPRVLASGIVGEDTPGPIYTPDYTLTRPPVAPLISMGHSNRKTEFAVKSDGPDALYSPNYSQIDPNSRSAIVYLTE